MWHITVGAHCIFYPWLVIESHYAERGSLTKKGGVYADSPIALDVSRLSWKFFSMFLITVRKSPPIRELDCPSYNLGERLL